MPLSQNKRIFLLLFKFSLDLCSDCKRNAAYNHSKNKLASWHVTIMQINRRITSLFPLDWFNFQSFITFNIKKIYIGYLKSSY